jgi:uncharacterized protein YggU (UPF0235/DUF167 family)
VRLEIHVRPGASQAGVGGGHDGALVVRVVEPADRGRATAAALRAVADALGVPPRSVTLVRGAASRRKVVAVDVAGAGEEAVAARLAALLTGPA